MTEVVDGRVLASPPGCTLVGMCTKLMLQAAQIRWVLGCPSTSYACLDVQVAISTAANWAQPLGYAVVQ